MVIEGALFAGDDSLNSTFAIHAIETDLARKLKFEDIINEFMCL